MKKNKERNWVAKNNRNKGGTHRPKKGKGSYVRLNQLKKVWDEYKDSIQR